MTDSIKKTIYAATEKVLRGRLLGPREAGELASAQGADLIDLLSGAHRIREHFRGNVVDVCSIVNAKSGACTEDCRYCAQSAHYETGVKIYPLIGPDRIELAARTARDHGASRFCVVTSGRVIDDDKDLGTIAQGIERVAALGLQPCATLGTLTREQLRTLRDAGLHRYHHNIETSREYFPEVCSTHVFNERLEMLATARDVGLSLCSGGILGMGESIKDRISMAITLRELAVDSIPINFLMPCAGTPLEHVLPLEPLEALQAIALFRFLLPDREVRICGGRGSTLGDLHPLIFLAGADGFMIGNYLTRNGLDPQEDLKILRSLRLRTREA